MTDHGRLRLAPTSADMRIANPHGNPKAHLETIGFSDIRHSKFSTNSAEHPVGRYVGSVP